MRIFQKRFCDCQTDSIEAANRAARPGPGHPAKVASCKSAADNGHENMPIGLSQFRDERVDRVHWMLALPFVGPLGNYPVNCCGEGEQQPEAGTSKTIPGNAGQA